MINNGEYYTPWSSLLRKYSKYYEKGRNYDCPGNRVSRADIAFFSSYGRRAQ